MKRRGRGFADGADVNAGDEADVSDDVPRAKARAASRDASPSDVPDWPVEDGARVSDLARLGDDICITPEKHAMTRANDDDDDAAPYTSSEVLEVLSPDLSIDTTECPSAYDVAVDLASPVAADRARLEALLEDAERERAAGAARGGASRRARERGARSRRLGAHVPRDGPREEACRGDLRRAQAPRVEGGGRARGALRVARRRRARRDAAMAPPRRKQETRGGGREARAAEARAAERAPRGPPLGRARRARRRRRATRRDAVRGVAPTRATRRGGARVARRRRGDGSAARAPREGRGRCVEESARPRDAGRAGCARALAFMDARSGSGQSRFRSRRRGRRRLLSRRWRRGRFGSPGTEKERARRRARRERLDGRRALSVRRRRRRCLRALAGRASDASRFGNVSRFVIR